MGMKKQIIMVSILLLLNLIMMAAGILGEFSVNVKILILLLFYIFNMVITLIIRNIYNKNKKTKIGERS
ncbi:MAG: hypothetical protein J5981_00720 [Lachnospira sp.]|nr:hypothetical protein [Lachnospira sp.]